MEGSFQLMSPVEVIRELHVTHQSGILQAAQGNLSKRVYFKNGEIVFASSDAEEDRLGERLIRAGRLRPSDRALAFRVIEESRQRFGRTVVEMGYLSDAELRESLVAQVQSIVYSIFEWDQGVYRSVLKSEPVDEDLVLDELSTTNMILDWVRRIDDPATIRQRLGDLDRVVRTIANPLEIYRRLNLTPEEGFVLSRVDGSSTAKDVVQVSPAGEEAALRTLYALASAGLIELEPSRSMKSRPVGVPSSSPKEATASVAEASGEGPGPHGTEESREARKGDHASGTGVATAPQGPAKTPSTQSELPPEEQKFLDDMQAKCAAATTSTFYELLDVHPSAGSAEIKTAYYRLAKRLHPDHSWARSVGADHALLDAIYLKITEAYEVLSDPAERRRYDFRLQQASKKTAFPERGERRSEASSSQNVPASTFTTEQMAELHFQSGKRFLQQKRYHESVEALRNAVRLSPHRANYHLLLGTVLAKNHRWRKQAEEHLKRALSLDRFNIESYLELGSLYEASGLTSRARKLYQEALGLDPGNPRALEKLSVSSDSLLEKWRSKFRKKER